MSKVLVTGGAGYIGSHTTLSLLQAGFEVIVLDNFCNSSPKSLTRVAEIAGRLPILVKGDTRDSMLLERLFNEHSVDTVLHFAGLKAIGESVSFPLRYYNNNLYSSLVLLQAMSNASIFILCLVRLLRYMVTRYRCQYLSAVR